MLWWPWMKPKYAVFVLTEKEVFVGPFTQREKAEDWVSEKSGEVPGLQRTAVVRFQDPEDYP